MRNARLDVAQAGIKIAGRNINNLRLQMVTVATKLRHLLLGRKVTTNLDSILKSRDITLPTKVFIVKGLYILYQKN